MYQYLVHKIIPDTLPPRFKRRIQKEKDSFQVSNGSLYRKIQFNGQLVAVPYLYHAHRNEIMKQTHETLGHMGLRATFPSLLVQYWWPGIGADYDMFCKKCRSCQFHNSSTRPKLHPRHPLPDPGVPFHTWHLDFIQDLPVSESGNNQILMAVDLSTRYSIAIALSSIETYSILGFVHRLSTQFGVPSRIITDRAAFFMNEFAEYCKSQNIQLDHSTSYHPQTNALVERTNGILENILRKSCNGIWSKWDVFLSSVIFTLNARHHSVTGFSPFYLAHGISPRLPIQLYTVRKLQNLGQSGLLPYSVLIRR
jgi:hypothetical protein